MKILEAPKPKRQQSLRKVRLTVATGTTNRKEKQWCDEQLAEVTSGYNREGEVNLRKTRWEWVGHGLQGREGYIVKDSLWWCWRAAGQRGDILLTFIKNNKCTYAVLSSGPRAFTYSISLSLGDTELEMINLCPNTDNLLVVRGQAKKQKPGSHPQRRQSWSNTFVIP